MTTVIARLRRLVEAGTPTPETCEECGYPQPEYNRSATWDCVCTGDVNCEGRALQRAKVELAAMRNAIPLLLNLIEEADSEMRGTDARVLMPELSSVAPDATALSEKLAASELENRAWRALFEHAEWSCLAFGLQRCRDGIWYANLGDNDAEGPTPQAAVIELATKLKLLDKAGG